MRLSQICLNHPFGVTAMCKWFLCGISVANMCLKIVANRSHPSEILALGINIVILFLLDLEYLGYRILSFKIPLMGENYQDYV